MEKPVRITMQVSPAVYAFARTHYRAGAFLGPRDYLNAVLNTAMLEEMERAETPDPLLEEPDE